MLSYLLFFSLLFNVFSSNYIEEFYKAKHFCETKDYEKGVEIYKRLLKEVKGDKSSVYLNMGECYKKHYKYKEAIEIFKEAISEYPENILFYKELVEIYKKLRNTDRLINVYVMMTIVFPYDYRTYIDLGDLLYKRGNLREAKKFYEHVYKLSLIKPIESKVLRYIYYRLFFISKRLEDIKGAYKYGSLLLKERNFLPRDVIDEIYKTYVDFGDYEKVLFEIARDSRIGYSVYVRLKLDLFDIEKLRRYIRDEKCRGDVVCFGVRYILSDNDYMALKMFDLAYKQHDVLQALVGYAVFYKYRKNMEKLRIFLKSLLSFAYEKSLPLVMKRFIEYYRGFFPEDVKTYYRFKYLYYDVVRQYSLSALYYKKFLTSIGNEKDLPSLWKYYELLYKAGDLLALDALKLILKRIGDENPQFFFKLGDIFFLKKKYRSALKYYLLGYKLIKSSKSMRWYYPYMIGVVYMLLKDYEKALTFFETAYKYEKNNSSLLNNLAYTYANLGIKLKEARELSEKSLEIDFYDPEYWDTLGWILFKEGDIKQAYIWIKSAKSRMRIYGDVDPDVVYHLAVIYDKLGNYKKAIENYKEYLALSKEKNIKVIKRIKFLESNIVQRGG